MGKPIYITGYMGSGKTTVGKKIARILDYDFMDTDVVISKMTGKTIDQIFITDGEDAFRVLEHSVLVSLANRINTVISTGGGTPCFFDNLEIMKKSGIVIYLKMHPTSIYKRMVASKNPRPLLKRIPKSGLLAYITEHLSKREQFYEAAHFVFKGESPEIESMVNAIKEFRK
ncbi:MAG: AAA family ATPase [Lentimicrobium sp.]|nr:AAA family ATPase [Lentimicrobium sp.]